MVRVPFIKILFWTVITELNRNKMRGDIVTILNCLFGFCFDHGNGNRGNYNGGNWKHGKRTKVDQSIPSIFSNMYTIWGAIISIRHVHIEIS